MDKKEQLTAENRTVAAGSDRTAELRVLMAERILVLDGAMGTMLQAKDLGPEDFGGASSKAATRSWSAPGRM